MQLEVKTILNRIQHFVGFVYQEVRLRCHRGRPRCIEIRLEPHRGIRARCSECRRPAPGYDQLPERSWLFVPLWGIKTYFLYPPRRVECPAHGVVVEHIPWSEGKRPITTAMMGFLARWARHLSWRQTARAFQTSWEAVYRSVEWFVQWGLAHRQLEGVQSIGIDEIHWGKGKRADNFLTVIYQIDSHCRRLLWVGRRRTHASVGPHYRHSPPALQRVRQRPGAIYHITSRGDQREAMFANHNTGHALLPRVKSEDRHSHVETRAPCASFQ